MNSLIQTLFQRNNKERLYTLTINVTKKLNRFIKVFLVVVLGLCMQQQLFSDERSLIDLDTDEYDVVVSSIDNINSPAPIFNFYSKALIICKNSNICGPGDYDNYIQIKSIIIFEGIHKLRSEKSSIIWELKFVDYSPKTITYGVAPYNAKEIVTAKNLTPEKTYSICIYTKNNNTYCSKWYYSQ